MSKETISVLARNETLLLNEVFKILKRILQKNDIQPFELAIASRKVCEYVLNILVPHAKSQELVKKIQALNTISVAPWVTSYFHLLRIFGNEYAHDQTHLDRKPKQMNLHDLTIGLFSLERVLEYFAASQSGKTHNTH